MATPSSASSSVSKVGGSCPAPAAAAAASGSAVSSIVAVASGPVPAASGIAKSRSLQQRKRKRLNAVLDKLTNHISSNGNLFTNNSRPRGSPDTHGNNNNGDDDSNDNDVEAVKKSTVRMFGRTEQQDYTTASSLAEDESSGGAGLAEMVNRAGPPTAPGQRKPSSAALRRELWRDNQQQSVEDPIANSRTVLSRTPNDQVFKFDSQDRER